ncbi:MAG: hypothetical protein JO112_23660 [Planctomycetes bacterium]|nr:hypothetical protein [Planctomycetota bacterium]
MLQRLPLPLAQLYRRALNAKTVQERHLNAFFFWEAGLKLLASVLVVEYAQRGDSHPERQEYLRNLARPALGHWWGFVKLLLPVLAERGVTGCAAQHDLLLGEPRDDLPRAAGLDTALREALEGKAAARATVSLGELFDRLVQYRNREIGHGAAGQRSGQFYERLGQSLLLGLAEVFTRLDVLGGRRLLYVAEVRQVQGNWLAELYELIGETARKAEPLTWPRAEAAHLPDGERVYLARPEAPLVCLHPLLIYDPETNEAAFLNGRPGKRKTEYLCYTTGQSWRRSDLGDEQRRLLQEVLGLEVSAGQVAQWAEEVHEEAPEESAEPLARRHLGEYELLSELGRGGMGIVYRA